jgi:uncharacterized membrane protein YeaQ/YmgE (transglycosylase-associated protein family)
MKKETLIEIILGTIGGLTFAIGMCMGLVAEWNMMKAGIVVGFIGFLILLCIIPVYKSSHPKKAHTPISWSIVITWVIGVVGALVMGLGMSMTLTNGNMILGIILGIIGLVVCVLNYPIYAYIKGNKD